MATNFVGKIDFQSTPCNIRQGGASGIRQEGKLLRRAQANKLPDSMTQSNQLSNNLTIINRQLEGQPGRLQSGFALHPVLDAKHASYALHGCGLLLDISPFRGLCVCISIGEGHRSKVTTT